MVFKYPIEATWLDLSKDTAATGNIPTHIPHSSHFLRVLQQTTGNVRATFTTGVMRSYLSDTDYMLSDLPLNMYKEKTPTAQYEFGNTKLVLRALRSRPGQTYSCDLRHATNRVGLITESGICYADDKAKPISKGKYQLFERNGQLKCDGLITNVAKTTMILYSADCILCKLEDKKTGAIGVFHAQWRNILGVGNNTPPDCEDNIEAEMIFRMRTEFGSNPEDIEAVVFPCISARTFEVKRDVARMFRTNGLEECVTEDRDLGEYHVDLKRAAIRLLLEAGISPSNIISVPYSTDDAYFRSYRLSREAIIGSDLKLLSREKYELARTVPPADKEMGKINAQNLLVVKKF